MAKKIGKIVIVLLVVAVLGLALMMFLFMKQAGFWFDGLKEQVVKSMVEENADNEEGEIYFYGASNFRLWDKMEEDMQPYKVHNFGLGGATDEELMEFADELIYPLEPSVVFIQTGSNDNVAGLSAEEIMQNKDKMYTEFQKNLPNTKFIVMAGLPLPGRAEYWESIKETNEYLKQYCEEHENLEFVDATDVMLTEDGDFRPEFFIQDGIHLNQDGHDAWTQTMKDKLEALEIEE